MRLADAIRLGSMIRPQGFLKLFYNGRSCALGAAYEAVGVRAEEAFNLAHPRAWSVTREHQWPLNEPRSCPACNAEPTSLAYLITHLNDQHRFTREQIAEFVDTVDVPTVPETVEAEVLT